MRQALELAGRGAGRVSPNPMVGAVLVKSGRTVGTGWHRRFGGPHAEIEALKSAGRAASGATLYVTMEPCCTCGKTGACTDALLAAGVRRVVAATRDPNPAVNGRGLRCLRAAGVTVEVGLLAAEARRLNEAYFCFHRERRPFFTLRVALTLDGMMATRDGESQWITGPAARRRTMALRCASDAVLVGVETVLRDDPRLTCRGVRRVPVLQVVLDSRLRTPPTAQLFREPGPVLVLTSQGDRTRRTRLERAGAEVVGIRKGRNGLLDWPEIAAELHRREIQSVLIEGGARVAASALETGIVVKVMAMHAPKLMGPGRCVTAGMRPRPFGRVLRLRQVRHELLGPDVLTEGYLRERA
ncbi:MAG TPA: bifunctional diaminohydroxyphosphoribosylaminopyrimidine deaminase/5-amino-6-(5-phosphoribosylamino)uracil reductase RibD [candidate division WOR-3 bacterium]|uniref:Riboflavin biosynthesis protein RibD n=1 Tax=candidate division WOR-3 bacterium TaxID=2052148 RepID=A0A7V0T5I0_UNCW3|nr:bifunctional diaminohydroxyphosphoribosylaminopyrimidine deaminase/5-amino-6-(5-phosphoribosylamino)uracil reductase RibD [candidate division WOR-3 bacterium]